jgi:hypothetical protein
MAVHKAKEPANGKQYSYSLQLWQHWYMVKSGEYEKARSSNVLTSQFILLFLCCSRHKDVAF